MPTYVVKGSSSPDPKRRKNRRPRWGMTAYRMGLGLADPMIPTKLQVDHARDEISTFFIREAQNTARMLNFDFSPAVTPPLSYKALRTVYVRCVETGDDFPVPAELCQPGFFNTALAAGSFHFVSDVARCQQELLGDAEDLLILAQFHTAAAELSNLSPLAIRLLEAHLAGRIFLKKIFNLIPLDDVTFAVDVVSLGIADAMLLELERHEDAAILTAIVIEAETCGN